MTLTSDPQRRYTSRQTRITDARQLRIVRVGWVVTVIVGLLLFAIGLPRYYDSLLSTKRYGDYLPILESVGIAKEAFAGYWIGLDVLLAIICTVIALFIFIRRSDDWLALALSQTIFFLGFSFSLSIAQLEPLVGATVTTMGFLALLLPINLFPDGTHKPTWMKWVSLLAVPYFLATIPIQAEALALSDSSTPSGLYPLAVTGAMFLLFLGVVGQVLRFRNHANAVQKQQTKFIVMGAVLAFALDLIVWATSIHPLLSHPFTAPDRAVYTLASFLAMLLAKGVDFLSLVAVPLAFGLAVTRTRLWDIDLVINRSLVYVTVSAIVAGVFGGVALFIQTIVGENYTTIAMFVSVVVAGALFNPVRAQVQSLVDRRLYGFRFDQIQLKKVAQQEARAEKMKRAPIVQTEGRFTGYPLKNYTIQGIVGRGGMGEVYRAVARGYEYAIKFLPDMWMDNSDARERFLREADVTSRLRHPHIVTVHEHGAIENTLYMVMDYIHGIELNKRIKQDGALPLEDALTVAIEIADALDYAHEQGLVHRDMKPSNIILRDQQDPELFHAMLVDFGVAKIRDATTHLTGTGAIGTIDYMAPEQIKEARTVDHRADIYALGVVVFEMLTGQRPFTGGVAQVMFAHIQQPPPDVRDIKPEIPRHIAHAINRALEKDVTSRFRTAGEFAKALQSP